MTATAGPQALVAATIPRRLRAAFRLVVLSVMAVSIVALLLWAGRDYRPSEYEVAVASYRFNLLAWEVGNVFDKWYRILVGQLPWNSLAPLETRIADADAFFQLGEEERRLEGELIKFADDSPEAADIRRSLAGIHGQSDVLRPGVEQTVESEISAVLVEAGFSSRIGAILPPVDTVLGHSPSILVTSPRDRIFRRDNTLLRHGIRPDDRNALEEQTLQDRDLSAIVVNTGGVGTFPTVVSSGASLHHA